MFPVPTHVKYMKNEIRSLIMKRGMPSFFITFSPADFKSPVCLKFCGMEVDLADICPTLKSYDDWIHAITTNPMAGSRFSHLMVKLFVKHVLQYGDNRPGLFGKTAAYYSTVEEQGCLTLHLHLLVWIKNATSPQELRDHLKEGKEPQFEKDVIAWLEGCHQGQFSTGTEAQIKARINRKWCRGAEQKLDCPTEPAAGSNEDNCQKDILQVKETYINGYCDPTTCLPEMPPLMGSEEIKKEWHEKLAAEVDKLVYLSNQHSDKHNLGCKR